MNGTGKGREIESFIWGEFLNRNIMEGFHIFPKIKRQRLSLTTDFPMLPTEQVFTTKKC